MGAENNNPKEETAPAIEQSERAIQRIEDISRDKAVDLGAKKEAAQKLHDEKVKAYEKAKSEGTSKGDREARRLDGEIQRLNTAIERIDQRLKVIARESREDKVDQAQKLEDRADELHNRAGIIESRDDVADKRDVEITELRVKEREQTAIIDNPASTPAERTAALKERADIREKIERKEARTDRAEEKLKREALIRAEAEQIRADLNTAERAEASLHEPSTEASDGKNPGKSTETKNSLGLTERMTSSSQFTALDLANNPPKKGDFVANMTFNLKLVWLKISMAMSPKPLAWDPKKFDEGHREILAKVAGMKLTDTEDGKMMIDSVPRDKEYEAPLGGTQRVFRDYFGTKWWTALNGITGPSGDKPGTKLSEFKAGIATPAVTEEDKAKQLFVDDLTKAGMKDDDQLLPWLEKNSSKVKTEGAKTENADAQVPTSAEGVTEELQNYPFLNPEQIQQLKSYPGFKNLEAVKSENSEVEDSTKLTFNETTHDFIFDGNKITNTSSFTITPGTDKVSIQVDDGKLTITIIDKPKADGSVASNVLVVQPKPAPAE